MAEASTAVELPPDLQPRRLVRRAVPVVAVLLVAAVVVVRAPGLGELRHRLAGASPGWLVLAVGLEALSGVSYVLMFRPIFCSGMPWRTSWEIGWSELAMGSIVPASGVGGLALGAWILRQGGMPANRIARRSVAFFLIKSSVNFVAVAVLGVVMAFGLFGPHLSLWLTAVPAVAAMTVIALVLSMPRMGAGRQPGPDAGRVRLAVARARRAVVDGTVEAHEIVRSRDLLVLLGSTGYWLWDNAVLWATFHAFGATPDLALILMGYLIGQLGGLLPLPGGLGGIDGGLFGTLVVYGAPVASTAAAVLAYRLILFWLPLIVGAVAFASLRRALNRPDRPELCSAPVMT